MSGFILDSLCCIFRASNEFELVTNMSHLLLTFSVLYFIWAVFNGPAPYGRFRSKTSGRRSSFFLSANVSWLVQECPSFIVPLSIVVFSSCSSRGIINKLLLLCFMLHYFMRSFLYSLQLRHGNPVEWYITAAAFVYCSYNGFIQSYTLLCLVEYPKNYCQGLNCILGVLLFCIGLIINVHSDGILTNLRKPGETGYKIPKGGLFEYVSSANYFGEIVEWCGFALATQTYPAVTFAISSALFLGLRARQNHRFYLTKFDNYPKFRKALIPYIW